jgi:hypothetical protein
MKKVRITESQLKSIVKRIIKEESSKLMEMGRDDVNLQAILKKYDSSSEVTQKAIANMVLPRNKNTEFNTKSTRVKIYKELRDMDYQEISSIRKRLGPK